VGQLGILLPVGRRENKQSFPEGQEDFNPGGFLPRKNAIRLFYH